MTTVALIHPPPHGEVPFRHIGLGYLQAALEAAGIGATLLDPSWEDSQAGIDFYAEQIDRLSQAVGTIGDGLDPKLLFEVTHPERFASISPLAESIIRRIEAHLEAAQGAGDVFLVSLNVLTIYFGAGLAIRLRARGGRAIAGGPAMRHAPVRRLLLRAGMFDAVVEGEGDGVVVDLVRDLVARRAPPRPGVSHPGAEGAAPGEPVEIDALPAPSFRGVDLSKFVPVLAARGCPHRCAFCSEPSHWERYRARSPERLVAEMLERADATGARDFHFHDDTINADPRWLDRFTDLLAGSGRSLQWESFASPHGLGPERLERLARSGCRMLKLGVQSFSPNVLAAMRRGHSAELARSVVIDAARAGIAMHFDMLTCFPGETDEDHRLNLEAIEDIYRQVPQVHFSPNPFYLSHGSQTMREAGRYGIELQRFDPAELPEPLAGWVRDAGELYVGLRYGISPDTVKRRLGDFGRLLERYGRDYQYLGRGADHR